MSTLPLILPSATGVEGIVRSDEHQISVQCQECGLIRSLRPGTYSFTNTGIVHHSAPWTSGHTDNPRLCVDCRVARGCTCGWCDAERRSTFPAWANPPWRWEGVESPNLARHHARGRRTGRVPTPPPGAPNLH